MSYTEVHFNGRILEDILDSSKHEFKWIEEYTWTTLSDTAANVKIVELDSSSSEYNHVKMLFDCTKRLGVAVKKIERVQNPYLLAAYLIKKAEYLQNYTSVIEKKLFHGTSNINAETICLNNFNWRLNGLNRGHKFGKGVSFSPKSSYAYHYCRGIEKVMFLANVLYSKSCFGNQLMKLPNPGCDTTQKMNGDVLVKYYDNEYYPSYKIYF